LRQQPAIKKLSTSPLGSTDSPKEEYVTLVLRNLTAGKLKKKYIPLKQKCGYNDKQEKAIKNIVQFKKLKHTTSIGYVQDHKICHSNAFLHQLHETEMLLQYYIVEYQL